MSSRYEAYVQSETVALLLSRSFLRPSKQSDLVNVSSVLTIIGDFITTGPPDPPTGVPSVTRSKNSVTIAWRSPAYDGGCTITGYTIEMNRREENCWTVIAESCHSLSHTVLASSKNSIVAGESYRFRVRGENIHGVGEPSAPSELVRIPREGETILQNEEEEGN